LADNATVLSAIANAADQRISLKMQASAVAPVMLRAIRSR